MISVLNVLVVLTLFEESRKKLDRYHGATNETQSRTTGMNTMKFVGLLSGATIALWKG